MNQGFRNCVLKGHYQNKAKYFCLNPLCSADRLLCSVCLLDNNHQHGNKDNKHILNDERLANQIELRIKQLEQQKVDRQKETNPFIQRSILLIQRMQENMQKLFNLIEVLQDISIYDSKIMNLQIQLDEIRQANYYQIDNQFLREMISLNQSNYNIMESLSNIIQETIQLCNEQMNQQQQLQIENLKNTKYEISKIDQTDDQEFYASAISNDLKYIISGGRDQQYKIWDNSNYKLILTNKVDSYISYVKFTEDSQFCYVGLKNGTLYQLDVQNNFHQSYQQKIHKEDILNLYCITNAIILTSSADKTIIKTDISKKQQLFLINSQGDQIFGLDYHRQRDIIVSCSDDCLSFWHNKDQLLMRNDQCKAQKVLFIVNNDQLLSLHTQQAIIWQINFENKEMVVIRSLANYNELNNISLVQNQSMIVLVSCEYILIYTITGVKVKLISHDIKEFSRYNSQQLDSMKSIIIQGTKQLAICRIEL